MYERVACLYAARHRFYVRPHHREPESHDVIERFLPTNLHREGEAGGHVLSTAERFIEEDLFVDLDSSVFRDGTEVPVRERRLDRGAGR